MQAPRLRHACLLRSCGHAVHAKRTEQAPSRRLSPGEGSVWSFQRASSELTVTVQSRLRVTAAEGVRAAVLAEVGLTIASEWMFSPELRSGAVRAVLLEWSLPVLDLWAVLPTGRAATAKARAFVDFFERTFNA
jgi:DNA-binding transcriptional LysR family regulator